MSQRFVGWMFWVCAAAAVAAWAGNRGGYKRGYEHGHIDGSNSGFRDGQKSVDCPGRGAAR